MNQRTDGLAFLGLLAGVSTTFGMLLLLPLYVKEKLSSPAPAENQAIDR